MRRGGSVSFVVEVKRRRFPQQSATTSDLDRGNASRISPIGLGASSGAPLIGSDPAIEAAKIAAKRFFSKPGSSQPVRADQSDPAARGLISRVEPARAVDVAAQTPATDLVASPPAQPATRPEKPRSGRVLQSLIVEDPIDALLRREDEERSTRHRPRGPRISDGTRTGSRQIPAHKVFAKPNTSFTESLVSTEIVEPSRRLRGRTVVTDRNPAVGTPRGKSVKRKAAKTPRRTGSLRRTANEEAGAKQWAQKRATTRSFDKKGIAKRAAAKKGPGKAAVAKKTTIRQARAKTRKIGKTKRSAAGATKTSTRAPKAELTKPDRSTRR